KGHGVALQESLAERASRRQHREIDPSTLEACGALDAADQRRVAVDLEQAAGPREAVQVVDVLRDDGLDDAEIFELDERAMPRVRLRAPERIPQLAHRAIGVQALFPGLLR